MAITARDQLAEYLSMTGEAGAEFALAAMDVFSEQIQPNARPGGMEDDGEPLTTTEMPTEVFEEVAAARNSAEGKPIACSARIYRVPPEKR